MTRAQAKLAVAEIAARADRKPVKVFLNGGAVLSGRVEYDENSGLLIVDNGRAFVRAEQTAAIEIIGWQVSPRQQEEETQ